MWLGNIPMLQTSEIGFDLAFVCPCFTLADGMQLNQKGTWCDSTSIMPMKLKPPKNADRSQPAKAVVDAASNDRRGWTQGTLHYKERFTKAGREDWS